MGFQNAEKPLHDPYKQASNENTWQLSISSWYYHCSCSGSQGPCASFHLFFRVWKASETLDLIFECTLYHKGVLGGGRVALSKTNAVVGRQGEAGTGSLWWRQRGGEIR